MKQNTLRPAWVEINLSNLAYNIRQIILKVGSADKIVGVVKADAYGHGAVRVSEILRENGIRIFAVATLAEAIELRRSGLQEEIIVLGLVPDEYAKIVALHSLTAVVCDSRNARALSEAASSLGKTISVLIAVDTGMGRIGYLADDTADAVCDIQKISDLPSLKVKGLFSHMSTADAADKTFSLQQQEKFNAFYQTLQSAGIKIPQRTLANSASVMELPAVHFDLVRPGIILYGCYPSKEVNRNLIDLKPVMSVKAQIVHLKEVPAGFSVGYGRRFIASRPSRIATIEVGYADGYPRPYSAGGRVIINGRFAPLAGNICMDQCMIDVTEIPGVELGSEVILMGSTETNKKTKAPAISAEDIAEATGTISYEILCAFGQRLPKVYL